jgi:hypothetical protein
MTSAAAASGQASSSGAIVRVLVVEDEYLAGMIADPLAELGYNEPPDSVRRSAAVL